MLAKEKERNFIDINNDFSSHVLKFLFPYDRLLYEDKNRQKKSYCMNETESSVVYNKMEILRNRKDGNVQTVMQYVGIEM